MSDEKKDESVPAMLVGFMKKLLGRDVFLGLSLIGAIAYITLRGRDSMAQSNQAQIDAGIAPTIEKVQRLSDAFDEHLKDDREFKRETMRQLNELAADNRANYKAMMTGERQYRLERPLPVVPDGGP